VERPESASTTREVLGERYELEVCLGSGNMGSVWRAYDLRLRRQVAIKRLHRQEPEAARRFEREMEALARLRHPNLVSVFDTGLTPRGDAYLVMELVPGVTLAERIAQAGRLSVDEASHIAAQIARGLSAAHAEGVVHRDLKPSNIMLSEQYGERDCVKLVDFGVSRLVDATQQSLSGAHFIGTPLYASPEQAKGEEATDCSDLYCLGIVLYEMLVGQPPFRAESAMGVLFQHAHAVAPRPSQFHPGIPAWLDHLLQQLLQKQQPARPSARSVLECLARGNPNAPITHASDVTRERAEGVLPPENVLSRSPRRIAAPEPVPHESAAVRSGEPPNFMDRGGKVLKGTVLSAFAAIGFAFVAVLVLVALLRPYLFPSQKAPAPNPAVATSRKPAVPIVIDDFESVDVRPSGQHFSLWEGYTYQTYGEIASPLYAAGFWKVRAPNSNRALRFAWRVVDPANGQLDHVGAVLQVRPANDYVDLAQNTEIVFSVRYNEAAGWPGLETNLEAKSRRALGDSLRAIPREQFEFLNAEFAPARFEQCSHRPPERPNVTFQCRQYETSYTARYDVPFDWKTITVEFASLKEPSWSQKNVPLQDCLSRVDIINFGMPSSVREDGACHSASMSFDDISIR
jgi:eukaryotic-like serine/threonine-protein kinase